MKVRNIYVCILLSENNEVWATDPGAERGSGAGQPAPQTAAGGARTSPRGREAENAPGTREWGEGLNHNQPSVSKCYSKNNNHVVQGFKNQPNVIIREYY